MKKFAKISSLILVLILVVSMGASSAFAAEVTPVDAQLYSAVSDSTVVSGSEVSGSTVSGTGFASYGTVDVSLKKFGFSMTLPNLDKIVTVDSPSAEIYETLGVTLDQMLSYGYLVYALSADESQALYVSFEESNYAKLIGNYNDLSDSELQDIANETADNYGLMGSDAVKVESINGNMFIHVMETYEEDGVITDYNMYTTIIDGVIYTVGLQASNVTAEDQAAIDKIVSSMNFSSSNSVIGLSAGNSNMVLIILIVILFLIVALLSFFIIRFSIFSRAAGSSFNIIGFDFPSAEFYDDNDDFYDDEESDDDKEDDEADGFEENSHLSDTLE